MKTVRILQVPPNQPKQVVPGVPFVAQTMGASEPGTGTIEAEGGETIVGDINRDGMVEHMRISGPSHAQGGVELDVDPGAFIFSDSKKLRIKDPAVLAKFTKSASKKGYTPAEIAKQYDVNTHVNTLKQDLTDPFAKQTAQYMLDENLKKLGELSLVQESMKGLPSGVPQLAEQTMMEFGGLVEFAPGGPVMPVPAADTTMLRVGVANAPAAVMGQPVAATTSTLPKTGTTLYQGQQRIKVSKVDTQALISDPKAAFITLSDGQQLTRAQWNQMQNGNALFLRKNGQAFSPTDKAPGKFATGFGESVSDYRPQAYSTTPQVVRRSLAKGLEIGNGDQLTIGSDKYEVLDAYGEYSDAYGSSGKSWLDAFDNTHGIVQVKDKKTGQVKFLEGEDITQARKNAPEYFQLSPRAKAPARARQAMPTAAEQAEQAARTQVPAADTAFPAAAPVHAPVHKAPPTVVKTQPRRMSPVAPPPAAWVQPTAHLAATPAPVASTNAAQSAFDLDD